MNIIIPMAGASRRFRDAGYILPKYMLTIYDKSLFNLSVSSFKNYFDRYNFIFIIRDLFSTKEFVTEECNLLGIEHYQIICLDTLTRGQAETVYLGLKKYNVQDDILIFNIDTIRSNFQLPAGIQDWDGYLEVFKGSGLNWSYAKVIKDTTQVIETAEKVEISDNCSTGIYFFKDTRYFYNAYDYYNQNNLNIHEYYIAPLYNYLIQQKKNIHIHIIPSEDVVFCGIPEEYVELLNLNHSKRLNTKEQKP